MMYYSKIVVSRAFQPLHKYSLHDSVMTKLASFYDTSPLDWKNYNMVSLYPLLLQLLL